MTNYDILIKRVKKAIDNATIKEIPACVHIVTISNDIQSLAGLVVIMHPDYLKSKEGIIAP